MTIKHKCNRRWYWPFKTVFLEHGKSLSSGCIICETKKLFKNTKSGKTISPLLATAVRANELKSALIKPFKNTKRSDPILIKPVLS